MRQGAKLLSASGVVITGIAAALLFRHPTTQVGPSHLGSPDALVLRHRAGPDPMEISSSPPPATGVDKPGSDRGVAAGSERIPTIFRPMDPGAPPPRLARSYPGADSAARSPAAATSAERTPWGAAPPDALPRTHRIVDGDTLPALAERYLGSADRSMEIYEANRDLLPTPDLLPIGAELTIPPRRAAPSASNALGLVPVPSSHPR